MKLSQHNGLFQFIRFNIVGIVNTVFTYVVYSCAYYLTGNHVVAVCYDYGIGICSSYLLNKHFTFKNKDKTTCLTMVKMVLSYMPSLVLNLLSLHLLIDTWHWNGYIAQLVTAFCIAYISFCLQKYLVFTEKHVTTKSTQ